MLSCSTSVWKYKVLFLHFFSPLTGFELVLFVNYKSIVRSYGKERTHKRLPDLGRGQASGGHPEFMGGSSTAPFLSLTAKTSVLKGLKESRLTAVVSTEGLPLLTGLLVQTEPAGKPSSWLHLGLTRWQLHPRTAVLQ